MTKSARLTLSLILGFALWLPGMAFAQAPSRIVSINLCTDELLLRLADPGQIAALSPYATDASLSVLAEEAKAFRHDAGTAETVVGLTPDLVLAGHYSNRATRDLLKRLGVRVVEFAPARSIAESLAEIRAIADLTGHPERGEAMVGAILSAGERARLAAARRQGMASAVFYQRRGYTAGGDTLTGELMALVGLTNAGGALAGSGGGVVPLERLVATRPDYLIVETARVRSEDQGSALLAHPVLARLFPPERRIVLPARLTVCGGVSLADAIDWLLGEAERVSGVRAP